MKVSISTDELYPFFSIDTECEKDRHEELFEVPEELVREYLSAEKKWYELHIKIGEYVNDRT